MSRSQRGSVRLANSGQGLTWLDSVRHGWASQCVAPLGLARCPSAVLGPARLGRARQIEAPLQRVVASRATARHGGPGQGAAPRGITGRGTARQGTARPPSASHGKTRHGTVRQDQVGLPLAWFGASRHDAAWPGVARHGHPGLGSPHESGRGMARPGRARLGRAL